MTNYTRHSLESRGLPENRHFSVISEASLAIAVLASALSLVTGLVNRFYRDAMADPERPGS
jgi:hypothetical protein